MEPEVTGHGFTAHFLLHRLGYLRSAHCLLAAIITLAQIKLPHPLRFGVSKKYGAISSPGAQRILRLGQRRIEQRDIQLDDAGGCVGGRAEMYSLRGVVIADLVVDAEGCERG